MEIIHILIIDIVCVALGVIGIWKIPLTAFFGMMIGLSVLFYEILDVGFSDIGVRMFTIITILICIVCFIGGYKKND